MTESETCKERKDERETECFQGKMGRGMENRRKGHESGSSLKVKCTKAMAVCARFEIYFRTSMMNLKKTRSMKKTKTEAEMARRYKAEIGSEYEYFQYVTLCAVVLGVDLRNDKGGNCNNYGEMQRYETVLTYV